MKRTVIIIFIFITSCSGVGEYLRKQFTLREILPKAYWIHNFNWDISPDIMLEEDFATSAVSRLYKVIIDSACRQFSMTEINEMLTFHKEGSPDTSALFRKLMSNSNRTGKKAITMMYLKKKGYKNNAGIEAYYSNDYETAMDFFRSKIRDDLDSTYINFLFLGKCYSALNDYQNALNSYMIAGKFDPKNSESYYQMAVIYYNKLEDYAQAELMINKALKLDRQNTMFQDFLGKIYCAEGEYKKGINEFNRLLADKSYNIDFLTTRGLAYGMLGNHSLAIHDFQKALKMDSTNKYALVRFGNLYTNEKKYDSAKYYFTKAIFHYPGDNVNYIYRADARIISNDTLGAIQDYTKALEIKEDAGARNSRGFAYLGLGKFKKAEEDFKVLTRNAGVGYYAHLNIAYAYNNLGYTKYKTGEGDSALVYIGKSLKLKPDNPYAYRNLALVYLSRHENTRACEALEKARALKFSDLYGSEVDELISKHCN